MNSSKFHHHENRCKLLQIFTQEKSRNEMFTLHRVLSAVVAVILISLCCWPFSRSTNRKRINKYAAPYTHAIISPPTWQAFMPVARCVKSSKMTNINTNHECHANMTIFNFHFNFCYGFIFSTSFVLWLRYEKILQ